MVAEGLVAELRRLTVEVVAEPDRLRVRPAGALPDTLKAQLREHKAEVLALLSAPGRPTGSAPSEWTPFLTMPLDTFARAGQPIEVRVSWWPETLWFVPGVGDVQALCYEGVSRPRVWTAGELISLLEAAPLTTAALLTVMRAREAFDGEVVEVRPR